MGLVRWQWDAVDWACVMFDRRIHNDRASRSSNQHQGSRPFYSSRTGFFGKTSRYPGWSSPLQTRFGSLRILVVLQAKIAVESEICECEGHAVHKLSQRRLTADWLAPRESDCSLICSKVSSDWLPSYIKAVLEIFKIAGYSPNWPRIHTEFYFRIFYDQFSDYLSTYARPITCLFPIVLNDCNSSYVVL